MRVHPHTKKSLGQHWLKDESMLNAIADAAKLESEDVVLEVGPGLGTLTDVLANQVSKVIAVEFDHDLAEQLPQRIAAKNVEVTEADILDYDFTKLPSRYKVVANIPYYLTSHLIRQLLESSNKPSRIVLLIQKEVAQRIVATPGKMSILAVSAQYYGECSLDIEVPASYFEPPPKVDSQVVVISPKDRGLDIDEKSFFRVVRAGFGEKRKKLANSLSGGLAIEKTDVADMLAGLGFGDNVRAQELSIENWLDVYKKVANIGK